MTVLFMEQPLLLPDGATLSACIAAHSPYGTEPVIAVVNGARVDPDAPRALSEGDAVYLYPLLIGG